MANVTKSIQKLLFVEFTAMVPRRYHHCCNDRQRYLKDESFQTQFPTPAAIRRRSLLATALQKPCREKADRAVLTPFRGM